METQNGVQENKKDNLKNKSVLLDLQPITKNTFGLDEKSDYLQELQNTNNNNTILIDRPFECQQNNVLESPLRQKQLKNVSEIQLELVTIPQRLDIEQGTYVQKLSKDQTVSFSFNQKEQQLKDQSPNRISSQNIEPIIKKDQYPSLAQVLTETASSSMQTDGTLQSKVVSLAVKSSSLNSEDTGPQSQRSNSDNPQQSSRSGNSKGRLCDSAIDIELEDAKQRKLQEKSVKFLIETILKSGDGVTPINDLMNTRETKNVSKYAKVLSTTIVVIHCYNFFTCFFFLGIEGYPTGLWFILECVAEIILLFDFILQLFLRNFCEFEWSKMYLLHNSITPTKSRDFKRLLVSLPTTIIVSVSLLKDHSLQSNIGFACLRLLKLLRWGEVGRFFDLFDLKQKQQSTFGLLRALFIIFYFNVFMHFWTSVWLITGRVDFSRDIAGWQRMDQWNIFTPNWNEKYIESYFFVLTTFAGAGFGNIVPSTNLEWFIDTFLNLIGSSLFICIFVDFVTEFSMLDLRLYKNNEKLHATLMFAESSNLPNEQVFKIRYYYKDLNQEFQDILMKKEIVRDLPLSIQGQVSLMLNRDIIENVKFLQMATPQFISELSRMLNPSICMNDDYIVRINDVADKMFFVDSGYVEVLCKNNYSPLIYFGKGAYFGEIGCLITGVRSVSVRAKSNAVIQFIHANELIELLDKFPDQMSFLRGVAQQRLLTTPFDNQKTKVEPSEIASNSSKNQFPQRYAELNRLFEANSSTSMHKKPWLNQKIESMKRYLVIPFSPMWWIWNSALIAVIIINIFLIPYGIGFQADFATHPLIIFGVVVYTLDIFVRMRTAITNDYKICTDYPLIFSDYINKWLILDLIATFPYEYIFLAAQDSAVRWVMLLKLLKIGRLIETVEIFRNNSRSSYSMASFFLSLFCLYGILMHLQACFLGWIGRFENTRNSRFDGKSYFKDFETRPYVTLGPMVELPFWQQYIVCLYLSGQVMQAVSYGDAVVYAMTEQILVMVFFVFTQTLRAFLMVRLADYLGKIQKSQIYKIQQNNSIEDWMKSQHVSHQYMQRIKILTHERRHSKNLFEGSEVLIDLPESLRTDIQIYLEEQSAQKPKPSQLQAAKRSNRVHSQAGSFISQEKQSKLTTPEQNNENQSNKSHNSQGDEIQEYKPHLSEEYQRFMKVKHIFEWVMRVCTTWNMWFIPLQFAYKFPFTGIFLALEIITILVYLADIALRFHIMSWMRNLDCVNEEFLSRKHVKVFKSLIQQRKETAAQYREIFLNCLAVIPFSLILQSATNLNMWIVIALCSLRMVKMTPHMKFFKQRSKDNLPKWRILSTLYMYYLFSHWCACIMIEMVIHDEDWTQNWLRRCPVPQMTGTRTLPDDRKDLSLLSVYVHAIYYVVGTVSHVAIGDITAVNIREFLCNAVFGWVGTFVYCLLFADITLLVSASGNSHKKKEFYQKRTYILAKLRNPNLPQSLVDQTDFYLNYTFECFQGTSQEEMLEQLPPQLKADFLLEKYKKTVEACFLLRTPVSCDVKFELASQLLKMLSTQIYLNGTFIVKVGEIINQTLIILDGNLSLMQINYKENSANLLPGDFYGTDLEPNIRENYNQWFFKKYVGYDTPSLVIDHTDNFESRSVLHLVAKKVVTVGFLNRQQLQKFYKNNPQFKQIMQKSNRFMFECGRKAIEVALQRQNKEITRDGCVKLITTHFESTTDAQYKKIQLSQFQTMAMFKLDEDDLGKFSKNCKLYYIENLDKEIRKHFKFRIMSQTKKKKEVAPEYRFLCCEEYALEERSTLRKVLTYAKFFNLIYICIATPFFIAFTTDKMKGAVLYLEIISHAISFICFLAVFRTPVVKETGDSSLELQLIIQNYWKNGMVLDIIAFLPINLVLQQYFYFTQNSSSKEQIIFCLLMPLSASRILTVQMCPALFYAIKMENIKYQHLLTNLSNVFFIFLFGHWCVCSWVFTTSVIEQPLIMSWYRFFNLSEKKLWEVYIRNWYAIANIVSSVGSGDIYGTTDIERLFFTFLMTAADVVFALAFGLLAELTSNSRQGNDSQNFLDKMLMTERIMQQAQFNSSWKDRVQQYLTYKNQLQTSTKNINPDDLKSSLPNCLVKEILYYSNKSILQALFIGVNSGNFLRDMAYYMHVKIFMPEDLIIQRGSKIQEIHFIVEGQAKKLSKKGKVMEKLRAGQFCGQEALFKEIKPKYSIRAETFILMKIISKNSIAKTLTQYPLLSQELMNELNQKRDQTKSLTRIFDKAFSKKLYTGTNVETEQALMTVQEEFTCDGESSMPPQMQQKSSENSQSEEDEQSDSSLSGEDSSMNDSTDDLKVFNEIQTAEETRLTRRKTEYQKRLSQKQSIFEEIQKQNQNQPQHRLSEVISKQRFMTPSLSPRININIPSIQSTAKKQELIASSLKSNRDSVSPLVMSSRKPPLNLKQKKPRFLIDAVIENEQSEYLASPKKQKESRQVTHRTEFDFTSDARSKNEDQPKSQNQSDRNFDYQSQNSTHRRYSKRRLSQMSIGSKLSIQQDESKNVVLDVVNIPKMYE